MISRRGFLNKTAGGLALSLAIPSMHACSKRERPGGIITGPNAALGHRLRSMDFPPPTKTVTTSVVIIGGGISGLSAARFLKKHTDDFLLLELESGPGGNSVGGTNALSAFPWGAHYLPLPGNNDPELISFLQECNAITAFSKGSPVFNEYYLCHDPKERLYINNFWQDSVIPHEGVPSKDRDEINRFLSMMHAYKETRGSDGKPAFAIPVEMSSQDKAIVALDNINAEQFLQQRKFQSSFLRWYANYCCADDYGSSLRQTSAWAMIHYFAARQSNAANAPSDAVLTWPEGNYWLVKQLKKDLGAQIRPDTIAYSVNIRQNNVEVLAFDAAENTSQMIRAEKVILASPQFINKYLLRGVNRQLDYKSFQYAPWMVANLVVNSPFNERRGEQLCWDNVIYGSDSLGYVNAMHQQVGLQPSEKVITYYKPLTNGDAVASRMDAYSRSWSDWHGEIVADLSRAHPGIDEQISEMNVWIWGHGMIRPSPGFIWGPDRRNAANAIDNRIFFAHSDTGGISIFEEAFFNGHKSARQLLGL